MFKTLIFQIFLVLFLVINVTAEIIQPGTNNVRNLSMTATVIFLLPFQELFFYVSD